MTGNDHVIPRTSVKAYNLLHLACTVNQTHNSNKKNNKKKDYKTGLNQFETKKILISIMVNEWLSVNTDKDYKLQINELSHGQTVKKKPLQPRHDPVECGYLQQSTVNCL